MNITVVEISGGGITESKKIYTQYFDSYCPPKKSNQIKSVPLNTNKNRKVITTEL